MEIGAPALAGLSGIELLDLAAAVVAELNDQRHRLGADREQLDSLAAATRVEAGLHAWRAAMAARLDSGEVAVRAHGTSLTTWLMDVLCLTRSEAGRLVLQGHDLARFPIVAEAAGAGRVLPEQAEAVTGVLGNLPDDLPTEVFVQAQELMVGFADSYNSRELRGLSQHLLEVVDPVGAQDREAARLEREERAAQRNRHLRFVPDHHGSILIKGSLPVHAAQPLVRIVEAYAAQRKRALDGLDPQAEHITAGMRRADGLLAMVHSHTQQALAPGHGGDRPRVVVTMTYHELSRAAVDAGMVRGRLVGSGEPVPAGALRRWLCDAEVMPVVLGGPSGVLDVGRAARLVTPAIRAALEARDQGCVFPGCDQPPQDCHAHHLTPWWAGGATAVSNLVLVCPHHHGIVEPGRDQAADRWKARIGAGGLPEVLPPRRVDPQQRARRHHRYAQAPAPPSRPERGTTMPRRD